MARRLQLLIGGALLAILGLVLTTLWNLQGFLA